MHINIKTLLLLVVFAAFFVGGVWVEKHYLSTTADEAENRTVVLRYMEEFINRRNTAVLDEVMVTDWIAHNPTEQNGREALKKMARDIWFPQFPELHADVKRIFADGDFVITQSHYTTRAEDRGNDWAPASGAVVDIFRLEDGKIVEHWDVAQRPIPEESVNGNSMFDGEGVYNYR